jgi:hypothetical protein
MAAAAAAMNISPKSRALRWLICLSGIGLLCVAATPAGADTPDAGGAASLRAAYASLRERLDDSPFQRPIALDSQQSSDELRGDVHAVIEQPFAMLSSAVTSADEWCEIMMLHLNVKHCTTAGGTGARTLTAYLGAKHPQPLQSTHRVTFKQRVDAQSSDYLQVRLTADAGPLSMRDCRIVLEAIPLGPGRSFVHMSYAYGYGAAAAIAMRAYFSTTASEKVGFTVVARRGDGQPVRVGGVRGALERNTMRYFLAIDAHLRSASAPPHAQLEQRLLDWFAATERYAPQLHELEQGEYLRMKRDEYRRTLAEL